MFSLLKKTDAFSMLVFTRTKHRAERIARVLDKQGFSTTSLHSDRSQNQRQSALRGFKEGKYQVMVATDIAARGLDIESVSHVINFDIPDTVDAYIHRIGRTGRAEREGDAFTLVTPEDNEMVRDIERALKKPIERRKLDEFDYGAPAPERPAQPQGPARPQSNRQPQGQQRRPPQQQGRQPQPRSGGRGGNSRPAGQGNQSGASNQATPQNNNNSRPRYVRDRAGSR